MAALEKRCRKMLFQKEKDYGNTITKIGRKKNKKNKSAKKKRKIKKERKSSLKKRTLTSSMVRRISNLFLNISSEKVSFCALNKKAICLKRSWDEVSRILDHACRRKCDCDRPKYKK